MITATMLEAPEETRLHELDREEFYDILRVIDPNLSHGEFEDAWAEFTKMKAQHQRKRGLN